MVKRRKYVFTPARRRALRKARVVSARTRHAHKKSVLAAHKQSTVRKVGAGVLAAGTTVGGIFVAYHAENYIAHPWKIPQHAKIAGSAISDAAKAVVNSGVVRRARVAAIKRARLKGL